MESQERTAAVSASRRIKVNWNLTYTPNSIPIPGQLLSGVGIPRMRGTAERQALPPAFMRGEDHEAAGGVLRSGGDGPLSHGFAVPALPKGEPRELRSDHRSFRTGPLKWRARRLGMTRYRRACFCSIFRSSGVHRLHNRYFFPLSHSSPPELSTLSTEFSTAI